MRLALYYSPYCSRCEALRALLRHQLTEMKATQSYEEFDVLEYLEAAVAAGVTRTPTLFIDGIPFTGTYSRASLRKILGKVSRRTAP